MFFQLLGLLTKSFSGLQTLIDCLSCKTLEILIKTETRFVCTHEHLPPNRATVLTGHVTMVTRRTGKWLDTASITGRQHNSVD